MVSHKVSPFLRDLGTQFLVTADLREFCFCDSLIISATCCSRSVFIRSMFLIIIGVIASMASDMMAGISRRIFCPVGVE